MPSHSTKPIIMRNAPTRVRAMCAHALTATHTRGETGLGQGPIECCERLGGLLKYYYREAA